MVTFVVGAVIILAGLFFNFNYSTLFRNANGIQPHLSPQDIKTKKDRFSQDNRILKAAATSQIIAVFWYKINFKSMTCFVSMCPLFLICFFPYLSFQKVKQYEFGRWFTLISFVTILCEKVRLYNICLSRILVYYWYGMVPT